MAKRTYDRITEIPDKFPLQHYMLDASEHSNDDKLIIGMDSGITNCAFAEIRAAKGLNADKTVYGHTDFEIVELYYFGEELSKIPLKDDKLYYIAEHYWELFSKKNVCWLCFERLPLNTIKDQATLSGVLDAQRTTDIITMIARSLGHTYIPYSAPEIKRIATGNGDASKEDVQKAMYKLTGEKWPILLENNHLADAVAIALVKFVELLKYDHLTLKSSVPEKFATALPWVDFEHWK